MKKFHSLLILEHEGNMEVVQMKFASLSRKAFDVRAP